MRVLVINGPNINMLGIREPDIYGKSTYAELIEFIRREADALGVEVQFFQSNHEGAIVDEIQAAYGKFDGIIINPAAYTHTSVALLDAVKAVGIPTVEVHISDPDISYIRAGCVKTIKGRGFDGYLLALHYLASEHK